jgi:hypothetical protein
LIETFPASIAVKSGAPVTFKVTGAIDFWGGQSGTNPDSQDLSDITAVGGVSGYYGPQGALVGVFLGFADASGFYGEPSCYGDNGGAFQAQVNLP